MWVFFVKNNRFSYLFLIALLALGAYSIISIPKESAPEVIIPVGVVSTVYPGAPASDVESLVTNEIERDLVNLENVKQITSTSREGFSNIMVEFEAEADLTTSIQDLKDEIDKVSPNIPDDADTPTVSEVNFVDQPIMTIALAGDLTDFQFTALADDIQDEIESVSGVSRVETKGVRDREVTVIVNQTALLQYSLSLSDVVNALKNANLTFPIGQISNNGISYNVAFEGDISDPDLIPDIPIATRSGQPIHVRDVAIVDNGLTPASSISRLSIAGQPSSNAITVDVYKQSGGDITKITAAVSDKITALKQPGGLLAGLETKIVLDAGDQINQDLIRLSTSGLQTVVLVILLLILTIGWREGLLAGTAIPLSFLFGFIGLYLSGNTINFLSLFSLILGIGILVDSSIVMVEGINRKMKDDPTIDKKEAAIAAIREFSAPLISGTLTTVAMFTGLFIVSGVIGQFIASIPFTLIFLLFASLFVSLTMVPLFAASVLHRRATSAFEVKQVAYAHKLENWYKAKLRPFIFDEKKQRRFLAKLFALLVFALSLAVNVFAGLLAAPLVYAYAMKTYAIQEKRKWPNWRRALLWYPGAAVIIGVTSYLVGAIFPTYNPVKVTFFEQSDVDFVIVELEEPEGTTKEVTDVAVRRMEEVLYAEPDIDSFTVTVGSGSQFGSGGSGSKYANLFVNLSADRNRTSTEIVEDLRDKYRSLPDLHITVSEPSDGPPTGAAVTIKFLGEDLSKLTDLANQSAQILRDMPEVINVETSTNDNGTEFVLNLDRDKAAALGLNPFVVSQITRTALYGTKATSLTTLTNDIEVVVKLNINNSDDVTSENTNETTIDALGQIELPTRTGTVPLSSVVTTSLRESSSVVRHEDGKRVVSVTADVTPKANAREVQAAALEQIKAQLTIPDSITLSTGGGETDESNKAFGEMFMALVVGVLLMVGILVLQFNSYLHTRYVLSILPYSLIGIMFGLAITLNPLSFPSIMGFIALSGIVVNNSILLIDVMNNLRREKPERDVHEIVLQAAGSRLRPILLTTITTVIGMVPLTYAGDLWAPLAYAVMFGLIFSVTITLVLIPILYTRKPGEINK